jgi:chromosome condensin MukBEF ATPase and DNA-binding subunit MukB
MTPDAFWAAEMQNRRLQQEQERYNQEMLMQGLSDMAGTYAENKAKKAKGAAYKKAFDVVGPSLGMNEETLKQFGGQFKNDNDWYEFGETMFPSLGVVSNLRMANRNAGIREQGQQIQQNAPYVRAAATNVATVNNQGGPSIMGATRRIGAPTGP